MNLQDTSEQKINHVSDTAFWVSYLRAEESKRPDALFQDTFAELLAGERGKQIAKQMPASKMTAWTVSLRTCMIDDLIMRAVSEGVDTILNLGAGLDTRPYRMKDLPQSVKWIEVDYHSVIAYKSELLKEENPHVKLQQISLDLSDLKERQAMLKAVSAEAKKIFVLTEGVVLYLSNDEVASLANDLHAVANISYWLLDYTTPKAREYIKRANIQKKLINAPFKFAPDNWLGFFKNSGWRAKEIRYYFNEAKKQNRPLPLPFIAKVFVFFKAMGMSAEEKRKWREINGYALLVKENS